ncbi:MAG: (2Fe-2S)-binding protein, partial [Pseudomonadota bacterium]
ASLVEIESPYGTVVVRALITDRSPQGSIFVPMHWTAQWSSKGRVDAAIGPEVDPISGQPESKAQPVAIRPFRAAWHGFALSRREIAPATAYWAKAATSFGQQAEIADPAEPPDWTAFAQELFACTDAAPIVVIDPAARTARVALMVEGRLEAVLFAAPGPVEVARAHLLAHFTEETPQRVLAGRPGRDRPDPGATVCGCFEVGVNTILAAITDQGLSNVDQIGAALQVGTNCGSCRPELARLLAMARPRVAAE